MIGLCRGESQAKWCEEPDCILLRVSHLSSGATFASPAIGRSFCAPPFARSTQSPQPGSMMGSDWFVIARDWPQCRNECSIDSSPLEDNRQNREGACMGSRPSSDVLRIADADTTIPTRACTATGCRGTMYLHAPIAPLQGPTHLEFPSYGSWVCTEDATHVELLTWSAWAQATTAHREEVLNSLILARPERQRPARPSHVRQQQSLSLGRGIVAVGLRCVRRMFCRR
jgi:hypothetical protein